MTAHGDDNRSRREFLRSVARAAGIGALALLAAALIAKRRPPGADGRCPYDGRCRGCLEAGRCRLPQAGSPGKANASK